MKTKFLFVMIVCTICLTSCVKDSDPEFKVTIHLNNGGDYTVINTRTNDTLNIVNVSADITIILNGDTLIGKKEAILYACNGDTIKMKFESNEEYKNYFFNTEYVLPNNKTIENQKEYEYVVENIPDGSYDIYLNANWVGEIDNIGREITANSKFILMVSNNN